MSNIEETKKKIEVMQAFVDGGAIQCRQKRRPQDISAGGWVSCPRHPEWTWTIHDYRVDDLLGDMLLEHNAHTSTQGGIRALLVSFIKHNSSFTMDEIKQRATELFGPCPEDAVKGCETCATSYTNNGSGEVCHKAQCWEHAGFPEWTPKQPEKSCETCNHELDDDTDTPCGACGERTSLAGWEPKQ